MQLTVTSVAIGVAIAVACAWYCRRLAVAKGRNVALWTALGLVLTVIAVPVLVLLPRPGHAGRARHGRAAHADGGWAPASRGSVDEVEVPSSGRRPGARRDAVG